MILIFVLHADVVVCSVMIVLVAHDGGGEGDCVVAVTVVIAVNYYC